jgi:hypothetical protein
MFFDRANENGGQPAAALLGKIGFGYSAAMRTSGAASRTSASTLS